MSELLKSVVVTENPNICFDVEYGYDIVNRVAMIPWMYIFSENKDGNERPDVWDTDLNNISEILQYGYFSYNRLCIKSIPENARYIKFENSRLLDWHILDCAAETLRALEFSDMTLNPGSYHVPKSVKLSKSEIEYYRSQRWQSMPEGVSEINGIVPATPPQELPRVELIVCRDAIIDFRNIIKSTTNLRRIIIDIDNCISTSPIYWGSKLDMLREHIGCIPVNVDIYVPMNNHRFKYAPEIVPNIDEWDYKQFAVTIAILRHAVPNNKIVILEQSSLLVEKIYAGELPVITHEFPEFSVVGIFPDDAIKLAQILSNNETVMQRTIKNILEYKNNIERSNSITAFDDTIGKYRTFTAIEYLERGGKMISNDERVKLEKYAEIIKARDLQITLNSNLIKKNRYRSLKVIPTIFYSYSTMLMI